MKHQLIATLLTSIALLTPLGAQAGIIDPTPTCTTNICEISITGGTYQIFQETSPGLLTPVESNLTNVKNILMNNTERGNVELDKFSLSPQPATMEVTFADGSKASFSNPLFDDWTGGLARSYITAAGNSVGITLSPPQLTLATSYFLNTKTPLGIEAWRLASDPNIATINLVNGQIKVGLDGLLNASNFLNFLFAGTGAEVPAGKVAQASEVVKVTYNGSSQYLYSFSATDTFYKTADGSYDGQYTDQTVPEPTTLLMLGLGFIGFGYMHRHNKRDQAIAA